MANDKVFSARADEETIERLNELAEKTGMKKAEILPALLNAWEANRVREALPGRTTEIDNFHNLLQQVEKAYTGSLELNVNAENRIRDEYSARIVSNEEAVQALRAQLDKAKAEVAEAKEKAALAEAERAKLAEELAKANEINATLKESLANANAAKESNERRVVDLEGQIKDMPKVKEEAAKATKTIEKLQAEAKEAELRHKTELLEAREKAADEREALRAELAAKAEEAAERAEKRHESALKALLDQIHAKAPKAAPKTAPTKSKKPTTKKA